MSVFLKVSGDYDYAAMDFSDHFDIDEVYQEMIKEKVTEKTLFFEDNEIFIEIYEFGEVDPEFVDFVINIYGDYDSMKANDFFRVK